MVTLQLYSRPRGVLEPSRAPAAAIVDVDAAGIPAGKPGLPRTWSSSPAGGG